MQMPSGLPARVVVVCSLIFGVAIARADRRQVAVIDLSGDEVTRKLAADLNPVLVAHPDLQPIKDPTIVSELYGPFRDDDFEKITTAANAKETAQSSLANYRFEIAQQNANNGQEELRRLMPSTAVDRDRVIKLYAELAFLRGQALLGVPGQAAQATHQFALAYRLDPTFVPDAARYLPDVVQAYDAAKRRWVGKGTLQIAGTGHLWIDGKDAGTAPTEIEVDAGPHVVWLTGADRVTAGAPSPIVEVGKTVKVEIKSEAADLRTKVRRARAALRYAPDPTARAAAMQALAALVAFEHGLLLSTANGTVIYQHWNSGTREQLALGIKPGFSALHELTKGEKPPDLLKPFAPPKKIKPVEEEPKPLVVEERWYKKRTWQATLAVGIVAALIGGYYIYKAATDDDALLDPSPEPIGRIRW